jgi:hypothetical protein
MKPFHVRGTGWLILASLVAVAALAWVSGRDATTPSPAIARAPEPVVEPGGASDATREADPAPIAVRDATPAPPTRVAKRAQAEDSKPVPAGVGGRVIAIDPETGAPGAPSPEQVQALRAAAGTRASVSRSPEGLRETRLSNGTVILDLDGRFQDFALARVDRHGNAHLGCVHDEGGLVKTLRDTIPVPALEEE